MGFHKENNKCYHSKRLPPLPSAPTPTAPTTTPSEPTPITKKDRTEKADRPKTLVLQFDNRDDFFL